MDKTLSKVKQLFEFDKTNKDGFDYVIGTDEAGRGPGAGPVFAAAVCFLCDIDEEILNSLSLLNDSKQLTEKKREILFEKIKELMKIGEITENQTVITSERHKGLLDSALGALRKARESYTLNMPLDCISYDIWFNFIF